MVFYRKNQRGEDAAKQLRGYKNTLLMEDLGEPNGCLLGMWGDIRETDSANSPIVYCDPNGVVKHIIIRSKHSEAPFRRTKRSVKAASSEYK